MRVDGHQRAHHRAVAVTGLFLLLWAVCVSCFAGDRPGEDAGHHPLIAQTTYDGLNPSQQERWRHLLFQGDGLFRPVNAAYYLGETAQPDLAEEFGLVEQYLIGDKRYTGAPEKSPWCRFPARFFYVASTVGRTIQPREWEACNSPYPAIDDTLRAHVVYTLESMDSGQSLFHIDLVIQGRRFHNGSALSLALSFSNAARREDDLEIIAFLKSFRGRGRASVRKDSLIGSPFRHRQMGWQDHRLNLPPQDIYLLALLGIEALQAEFPYDLRRANCHTYLQKLVMAVVPEMARGQTRLFFDYFPEFMGRAKTIGYPELFQVDGYRPSEARELDAMVNRLTWQEYRALQNRTALDRPSELWRQIRGKQVGLLPINQRQLPENVELRDHYLESLATQVPIRVDSPPERDGSTVPLFQSPHPSQFGQRWVSADGGPHLETEIGIFSTVSNQLKTVEPLGFSLIRLKLLSNRHEVAFDRLTLVEEKRVNAACCSAALHGSGFREVSAYSIELVNDPLAAGTFPGANFKPHLVWNVVRGIGTFNRKDFSIQILPAIGLTTYGKHIRSDVDLRLGWTAGALGVALTRNVVIHDPTPRRDQVGQSMTLEYQLSGRSRLEVAVKDLGPRGFSRSAGYAFAF